jgi:hypothetical protein
MGSEFPIWPLFLLAGAMTLIAGGIFAAVLWNARKEKDDGAGRP